MEPPKTSVQPLRGSVPECSQQCPPPCGLHCPGHTVLHVLEGAWPSLIQLRPLSTRSVCVLPLKKALKDGIFRPDEDIKSMMVQWFQQQTRAGASVGCLSQCPLGLLLMASLLHQQQSLNGFHLNKPHNGRSYSRDLMFHLANFQVPPVGWIPPIDKHSM
jgi:hypothetical protein